MQHTDSTTCLPRFFPDPGVDRFSHTGEFFVVRSGKVAAIFTSRVRAEDMTIGVLGSSMITAPTWDDALDVWTAYCIVVHQRSGPCKCDEYTRTLLWGIKGVHCTFTSKKEARESIARRNLGRRLLICTEDSQLFSQCDNVVDFCIATGKSLDCSLMSIAGSSRLPQGTFENMRKCPVIPPSILPPRESGKVIQNAPILPLNRRFLFESPPPAILPPPESGKVGLADGKVFGQEQKSEFLLFLNVPKDGMDKSANLTLHDNEATSQYWAVCKGHIPGIYLDHTTADHQIHGFRNNLWRAFDTHAEALAFWRIFCHDEHDHSAREYKVRGVVGTFKTYDDAIDAAATAYIVAA
ncbi:hypothetical protein B0H13DRAFT_1857543 [Mycena leptocephala]|nr:hypothetical protein B0H13DRAFT_1857543 [Mycena leptocephala]